MSKNSLQALTSNKWLMNNRLKSKRIVMTALVGFLLALSAQQVSAQPAETPQTWHDPVSGIEFIKIAPGCMHIGTDNPQQNKPDEEPKIPLVDEVPRHQVCLDGFWLGKFELTRAQWHKIIAPNSDEIANSRRPKLYLERADAEQFLQQLNTLASDKSALYRLPTEAEWEYSCRAGEPGLINPNVNYEVAAIQKMATMAWFHESESIYDPHARDVGKLQANPWGLYDMLGNAMELVQDDYLEQGYRLHSEKNPLVEKDGSRYVIRGASYKSQRWQVRCGARNYGLAGEQLPSVGMRVVKTIAIAP